MYQYLLNAVQTEYDFIRPLSQSDRSRLSLLRHKATGTFHVLIQSVGTDAVYRQLMQVSCPHLPRVEEVACRNGQVLGLEEYIQGDNLAELLEVSLPSRQETLKIIRQLCWALEVLHSLGAVHRDIKPENVILRGGDAVLIDFDASRLTSPEHCRDTQVLGTTGYAAPEQFGIGQTDARTDLYSLGVLLNILLTGLHPSVHMAGGRLGRIVQKCTMMNPADRFQNTSALLGALPLFLIIP